MSGRPVMNHQFNAGAAKTLLMVITLAASLFASGSASAQVLYGSITGAVTDKTGAVVPGVTITITNQGTGE